MSNKEKKDIIKSLKSYIIGVSSIVFVIMILWGLISNKEVDINAKIKYKCDYVNLALSTKIKVYSESDELLYSIEGKIFKAVTDPLTLYDEKQNHTKIMYAGDKYNFYTQDSHIIQSLITNKNLCEMDGNFKKKFEGDSYDLYVNNTQVGIAKFNTYNNHGEVKTMSEEVIAEFSRDAFMKDYTVQIKENNIFSDETLLMIFASYVSDYTYDNSKKDNKTKSNKNKDNKKKSN